MGNPGVITLYRFAHDAATEGSAVVAEATGATCYTFHMSIDQENDLHCIWDGPHSAYKHYYNIWDKSAGAWAYTFDGGDKEINALSLGSADYSTDAIVVADTQQTGSNKKAWVIYKKDNLYAKRAIYYKTVVNGTVSAELTIKTSASQEFSRPNAILNTNAGLLHVVYVGDSDGILTNTITSGDVLGSELTIDAAATNGTSALASYSDTQLAILYRIGAYDNAASEARYRTKNIGYTLDQKIWESVTYTIATNATTFYVAASEDLPTGTSITWEITADQTGTVS